MTTHGSISGSDGGSESQALLEQLERLRADHHRGQRMLYRQGVLLWGISRAVDQKPRLVPFSSVSQELKKLLAPLALGKTAPDPASPWSSLRRTAWWELDLPPDVVQGGARGRDLVHKHDLQGGLTAELYERLRSDRCFRDRAVQLLAAQITQPQQRQHVLQTLGFAEVSAADDAAPQEAAAACEWDIAVGQVLERRELHARYGGARYGRMAPSSKTPNFFLFTDEEAVEASRYAHDGWRPGGRFHYTGAGHVGEQTVTGPNRAVLDHVSDGRTLRLFESKATSVRYLGEFTVDPSAPYDLANAPARGGDTRRVIIFHLLPVGQVLDPSERSWVPVASATGVSTSSTDETVTRDTVEAGREEGDNTWRERLTSRRSGIAIAVGILAIVDIGLLLVSLARDDEGTQPQQVSAQQATSAQSSSPVPSTTQPVTSSLSTTAPVPSAPSSAQLSAGNPPQEPALTVSAQSKTAEPFETIPLTGHYEGAGSTLRMQQRRAGIWITFPLPTTTDASGNFTAYVELGEPGPHRLRVVSATGAVSNEITVTVR